MHWSITQKVYLLISTMMILVLVGSGVAIFNFMSISSNAASVLNVQHAILIQVIVLISEAILVILIGYIFHRMITIPLKKMAVQVKEISSGNLAVPPLTAKARDELGDLARHLNQMVEDYNALIRDMNEMAIKVSDSANDLSTSAEESAKAAEQMAKATQQVASGAETQEKSVQESLKEIEDVAKGMENIRQASDEMAKLSEETKKVAADGKKHIEEIRGQMNRIDQSVQQIAGQIQGLGDRSQAIGQIVSIITDIASQTNLLALNAAIEAARAGEHGRGFAVVAEEVRKLAEQSEKSAREITQLITQIQEETDQAVQAMQEGTVEVKNGVKKAEEVDRSFNLVQTSVEQVSSNSVEIAGVIHQVAEGNQHVVKEMDKVSQIAMQLAASAEESSAASEEQLATMEEVASSSAALARLAEQVQKTIQRFKLEA